MKCRSNATLPRLSICSAGNHILGLVPLLWMVSAAFTAPAAAQVFFSEYIEGSTTNKALEIYNGTATTVDLSADAFQVLFYFDGSATPSRTIELVGQIVPGDVFVLAHQNAGDEILARADQVEAAGFFDGNDAIALVNQAGVADVIGQIGTDPGTQWGVGLQSTRDNTLCRKSSILTGDPNGADAFGPAVEWIGYVMDTFEYLGDHTAGGLPVELTSFVGVTAGRDVLLTWTTASERSNAGFEIERTSDGGGSGQVLGFVGGVGQSDRPVTYSYRISNVEPGLHVYRLKQIDLDGTFEYVGSTEVYVTPDRYGLLSVYPNPFNPVAKVVYALPAESRVRLSLFDVTGREVAGLFDGLRAAGIYSERLQASGLASGLYVIRLQTNEEVEFRTIVVAE